MTKKEITKLIQETVDASFVKMTEFFETYIQRYVGISAENTMHQVALVGENQNMLSEKFDRSEKENTEIFNRIEIDVGSIKIDLKEIKGILIVKKIMEDDHE